MYVSGWPKHMFHAGGSMSLCGWAPLVMAAHCYGSPSCYGTPGWVSLRSRAPAQSATRCPVQDRRVHGLDINASRSRGFQGLDLALRASDTWTTVPLSLDLSVQLPQESEHGEQDTSTEAEHLGRRR